MFLLKMFILIYISLAVCFNNVKAAGVDPNEDDMPFCLSKSTLNQEQNIKQDFCRYYKRVGSEIKFKDDLVYGSEYDSLNKKVEEELNFVTTCAGERYSSFCSYDKNFLTVILAATGSKGQHIKRCYTPLYVKSNEAKPVVFCCDKINVNKRNKEHPERMFVKAGDTEIREDLLYDNNNTHTEPLALRSLLTLNADTFNGLLPKKYTLDYCEVHFISTNDACLGCAQSICKGMEEMKVHFHPNLFMFFHGVSPYGSGYTVKFNDGTWKGVQGRFRSYFEISNNFPTQFNGSLQQRSMQTFQVCPSYYIATFRDIEDTLAQSEYGVGKLLWKE